MGDKYQILLADDDEDDRFLLKSVFDSQWPDCQVIFAVDGADLVEQLEQSTIRPNLILLDLNMPRMDGFATLAYLRRQDMICSTPVVIFTTSSSPDHIRQAYELGASSFITKPSNYRDLVKLLGELRSTWQTKLPAAQPVQIY